MKFPLEKAFVLHRKPWSETSLVLDLFCKNTGRIQALAKGAYKKGSSVSYIVQAFRPLLISWSGRGEIKNLNKAEAISRSFDLSQKSLYCGIYVNEVLMRVLKKGIPFNFLFNEYFHCLQELSDPTKSCEPTLRRIELSILKELGYEHDFLSLIKSTRDTPINSGTTFSFKKNDYSLTIDDRRKKESFTIKHIIALWKKDFPDKDTLRAAKRFTRIALTPHLGPKPLKSRDLFS